MIISLTQSKHTDNVVEIMFTGTNNDWFVALFPLVDADLNKMKKHYIGKGFYKTKKEYEGRIFAEGD
jgi:hypothetical protein